MCTRYENSLDNFNKHERAVATLFGEKTPIHSTQLKVNGKAINWEKPIKHLEKTLDPRLKLIKHVIEISTKARRIRVPIAFYPHGAAPQKSAISSIHEIHVNSVQTHDVKSVFSRISIKQSKTYRCKQSLEQNT